MIALFYSLFFLLGLFVGRRFPADLRGGKSKIIIPRKLGYPRA